MEITTLMFILAIAFGLVNVVITLMIAHQLDKRGIPVSYLLLKILILKYLGQYKEATKKESGRPGSLYYIWITSINLALVCVLLGLFL